MADGFQYGMVLMWARVLISRLCRLLPRLRLQLSNVTPDIRVVLSALDDSADDRLAMADAQGWATALDPAFYDYYPGDGSRWRFGAAPSSSGYLQLVEHRTPQGRAETAQDMGLEIVRDADGVLRQVRSAAWFADFVVTGQDAYDLSVYPNDASCVPGARTAEGYN